MRGDLRQIELQLLGVVGVRVRGEPLGVPSVNPFLRVRRRIVAPPCEEVGSLTQPGAQHLVEWKHAGQGAPLGGHIRDGQPLVHGEVGQVIAGELHAAVEHFVLVVHAAQRDDHVFAHHSGSKPAGELHLHDVRHFPPRLARGPDGCGVRADDRRSQRGQGPVQVRVRIGRHHQAARRDESLLHHDLVPDARARREEPDAVLFGKRLDLGVLGQVVGVAVLNVVIDREHRLVRVGDAGRPDALEL